LQEATDIDEHLPVLRDYASRVGTVAEMGVRSIISTYAFLKVALTHPLSKSAPPFFPKDYPD
jgi:hypothetical protein